MAEPNPLLSLSDVSVRFGGVRAVSNVSFSVPAGQICGVIGPNGAGKTTLFNAISRLQKMSSGEVFVDSANLASVSPHNLVKMGVARTFQHVGLFAGLSVFDNVKLGAAAPWSARWRTRVLGVPPTRKLEREFTDYSNWVMDLLDIQDFSGESVNELPFGSTKRVELARALAARPRLLLLDEPAGGLTQEEVAEFGELIQTLRSKLDLTIVIVEHHMGLVSSICDRLVVLDHGELVADGDVEETLRSAAVQSAYFGTGDAE